ncbi:MAG: BACON domain-containing carbohydrate-binding protein [candidate division KSB1 bacterium]|nr:BACON domain-containing carbohydrate-binding protein [candidate division KSB1 bacterium]
MARPTVLHLAALAVALLLPALLLAQVNFGGYTFQSWAAFADEATEVGSPPPGAGLLPTGTTSINTALTDRNLNTWVVAGGSAGMADVRFIDNVVVNEDGADFVVFEYGVAEAYRVAVSRDGTTANLTAFRQYVGTQAIDLSDFGIAAGATVTLLRIQPNPSVPGSGGAELSAEIQDIGALHSRAPMALAKFDFNDGTVQGWTLDGAFDETGATRYSSNFFDGWQDAVNYPNPPGLDPMNDQHGTLRLATLGGHGITNPGHTWWVMKLVSPDLSGSPTWQAARGFSVEIAECMANFGSAYANLWVFAYDHDQALLRAFYSGTAEALTHDVYGDGTANWNHLKFDWSAIPTFPTNYTIQRVAVLIWGKLEGVYYEGGIYLDEVTPLGGEQPQPPAAPSNLQAYQTVPQIHITWQDNSDDEAGFQLEFKDGLDAPWDTLANLGPNVTSYQMDNAALMHTYVFRVAAVKDGLMSAYSNTDTLQYRLFLGFLRVDTPNGGEVWPVGSTQTISWTAQMIPLSNYAIEYSTDGGSRWSTIVPLLAPCSSYNWTIPNTPSTNCIVKVRLTGYEIYDLTDHPFTITTQQLPVLVVTPSSHDVPARAGTTGFEVDNTGGGTMNWTATVTEGASWLTITSGASGTNKGTIVVAHAANPSTTPRSGTITVTAPGASGSPCQVTVNQSGAEQPGVTVRMEPAKRQLYLNRTGSVDVVVEGVTNIGSFQFEIGYDRTVVQLRGSTPVQLGPFLGSTGRTVIPVGPAIDTTAGTVVFGAATFGTQAGPNGNGTLATITWTGVGEGSAALDLRNVQVSDINGVVIPVAVVDGEIIVKKGFWADVNNDDRIDIIDIQLVCAHWNTRVGDPNYDPRYDVDNEGQGDGDIDIIDIQLVAAWWNRPLPPGGLARSLPAPPVEALTLVASIAKGAGRAALELWTKGAANLGGFQFDLVSSAPFEITSFAAGDILTMTGNTVSVLGPQHTASGKRATVAAFSFGNKEGGQGSGVLGRIELNSDAPVQLERIQLATKDGTPIPVANVLWQEVEQTSVPRQLTLRQNYPNPFNPQTKIEFELPGGDSDKIPVTLSIHNLRGEVVRVLLEGALGPGAHAVLWDGCDEHGGRLPSGVYVCRLDAGKLKATMKMALMR